MSPKLIQPPELEENAFKLTNLSKKNIVKTSAVVCGKYNYYKIL